MSYIGGSFKHDLFVTYSHGAVDAGGDSPLKQWSDGFVRELERELRQHPTYGRDLALFFDDSPRPGAGLDPMAQLTPQLRDEVRASALIQVLMSPQYLMSKWCERERAWWLEAEAEHGLTAQDRIALARIWPTTAPWPAPFLDEAGHPLPGICFFDEARAAVRPQPFEWPAPDRTSKGEFRDRLLDLVSWLWQRVEVLRTRMDERLAAKRDAARLAEDAGQVLYLHGRIEHEQAWRSASDLLRSTGFTVFPGQPETVTDDPVAAQRTRRERVRALADCDALLLLATDDASAVDADLIVVGRRDRQSARALSQRLLPCGLIDTAGAALATPERRQAAQSLQVDWIDGTRPPWPQDVQSWLTRKGTAASEAL